jgi:hypothetical protein
LQLAPEVPEGLEKSFLTAKDAKKSREGREEKRVASTELRVEKS